MEIENTVSFQEDGFNKECWHESYDGYSKIDPTHEQTERQSLQPHKIRIIDCLEYLQSVLHSNQPMLSHKNPPQSFYVVSNTALFSET